MPGLFFLINEINFHIDTKIETLILSILFYSQFVKKIKFQF